MKSNIEATPPEWFFGFFVLNFPCIPCVSVAELIFGF
jgi:hypothetical protein